MNHTLILIIAILMFAVITAILYMIGLRKKVTENERLTEMLLNNAALIVVKYLKDHDTVTEDGIGYLIKEIKAREFYSKKTAVITNGKNFQKELIDYMIRRNHISKVKIKGKTCYKLPEKEK